MLIALCTVPIDLIGVDDLIGTAEPIPSIPTLSATHLIAGLDGGGLSPTIVLSFSSGSDTIFLTAPVYLYSIPPLGMGIPVLRETGGKMSSTFISSGWPLAASSSP